MELPTEGDLQSHIDEISPGVHGTGTMALQNFNSVNITGGQISGLSDLQVNGNITLTGEIDETA